jgi:hypothetical protein
VSLLDGSVGAVSHVSDANGAPMMQEARAGGRIVEQAVDAEKGFIGLEAEHGASGGRCPVDVGFFSA